LNTNYKGNGFPNINEVKVGGKGMDKNKEEIKNFSGNHQGVADDRKHKIDELREKEILDEETEHYTRLFLEL
jgi:hypothetical protein